jgi:broad-specificity NMP kinase
MRILITGMSGTGKSSVIAELWRLGQTAVDMDEPGWSEYRPGTDASGNSFDEWVWREDRVAQLLANAEGVLFVSGCASNQAQFYPQFDHVVLLRAPLPVIQKRIANRSSNSFGKDPREFARIMEDIATVEPLLRRRATLEIDTDAPLEEVVRQVLRLVEASGGQPEHSGT